MLRYGPQTALVVVDLQNDFADPAGSLYVQGGEGLVATINQQVSLATTDGSLVAYTQDWHPEHTPHFAQDGGIWPVHCVADTWGAAFHPDLDVRPDAPVVRKGTNGEDGYSAFSMRDPVSGETMPTPLGSLLHDAGVRDIVVVGLATDYCVKSTVLDGIELGFRATLLRDAVAAVNLQAGDEAAALQQVAQAGCTIGWTVPR